MFSVVAQATASAAVTSFPEGEIHSFIILVSTRRGKKAQKMAVSELEARGWTDVRLALIGEQPSAPLGDDSKHLRDAFESAAANGIGVVVYEDADPGYNVDGVQ